MELFVEKHKVMQWLNFIFKHADPIIVARSDLQTLNTNQMCRSVFEKPEDTRLPDGIHPDKSETENSWIVERSGNFRLT